MIELIPPESLRVEFVLQCVGDHLQNEAFQCRLAGDDFKCGHSDQLAADGVRKRLCRHDPDTQSGIAAGTQAHGNRMNVARLPLSVPQKFGDRRHQILRVPSVGVEAALRDHRSVTTKSDEPLPAGRFQQ